MRASKWGFILIDIMKVLTEELTIDIGYAIQDGIRHNSEERECGIG